MLLLKDSTVIYMHTLFMEFIGSKHTSISCDAGKCLKQSKSISNLQDHSCILVVHILLSKPRATAAHRLPQSEAELSVPEAS